MPTQSAQTINELVQVRKNAVLAFLTEWQSHSVRTSRHADIVGTNNQWIGTSSGL